MAISDFHNRDWLITQLEICSIRELANREGIKPASVRYWIKKHKINRSSISEGMRKRSSYISSYSSTYWANNEHRQAQSEKMKIIQSQRKQQLSESSKLNWRKNRELIIKGIKKSMTISRKKKLSQCLKNHWQNKLQEITISFIEKAKNRHNNRFNYSKVVYASYFKDIDIICNTCNKIFQQTPSNHIRGSGCPYCNLSQGHNDISTLFNNPIINSRNIIPPFEIDVYDKELKLGVEYHGMFWHSFNRIETTQERLYHQTKWILSQKVGIQLLQFYEHEWVYKTKIVESIIKNRQHKSKRLHARSFKIQTDICPFTFYEHNHLQSGRHAKYNVCLMDNDEIVMAASWNPHKEGYELIRMATKIGYNVRGGVSKLFNHFIKTINPSKIITYADLRYTNATGYRAIGFIERKITRPGYFYCKGLKTISRQQCQKHKLGNTLATFDPLLTEAQNMFNNGYRRMWDAGHLKLELII